MARALEGKSSYLSYVALNNMAARYELQGTSSTSLLE